MTIHQLGEFIILNFTSILIAIRIFSIYITKLSATNLLIMSEIYC